MNKVQVLDKGFVILRNVAGPTRRADQDFDAFDTDPANAARMSFDSMDKGRTVTHDMRLNNYLIRNKHTSPIEMVETWWEIKMPMFVARQWVRHRTHSMNEVSARYVVLPDDWYIPQEVGGKAEDVKQGRGALDQGVQERFRAELSRQCADSYAKYKLYLEYGVAPEHARMMLHMNHYTHFLWKQNLHNLWHLIKLRDHEHAQWEVQQYAKALRSLLREQLPDLIYSLETEGKVGVQSPM